MYFKFFYYRVANLSQLQKWSEIHEYKINCQKKSYILNKNFVLNKFKNRVANLIKLNT